MVTGPRTMAASRAPARLATFWVVPKCQNTGAHARPLSFLGGCPPRRTAARLPSEFNHVAVGVGHVGERLAIRVLASPDQPPPSPLNLLDRPVEILLVDESEAKVAGFHRQRRVCRLRRRSAGA